MFLSLHHAPSTVPALVTLEPGATLSLHDTRDTRRGEVEDFIRGVYARCYGAQVRHFAPVLVGLRENGVLLAAAGYRNAGAESLYLERYLPSPVETLVAACSGTVPERGRIVEVGHLAATRGGDGRRLIRMLALHLAGEDFEWIVGTVTQELQTLLGRLGVTSLALGAAEPTALGEEAVHWGRYYEHHPVVLATHLRRALRRRASKRSGTRRAQE
jgi:hypothetical protein